MAHLPDYRETMCLIVHLGAFFPRTEQRNNRNNFLEDDLFVHLSEKEDDSWHFPSKVCLLL